METNENKTDIELSLAEREREEGFQIYHDIRFEAQKILKYARLFAYYRFTDSHARPGITEESWVVFARPIYPPEKSGGKWFFAGSEEDYYGGSVVTSEEAAKFASGVINTIPAEWIDFESYAYKENPPRPYKDIVFE